jgi:hypothetical protein
MGKEDLTAARPIRIIGNEHLRIDWCIVDHIKAKDQDKAEELIAALPYKVVPMIVFLDPSEETKGLIHDVYNETWLATNLELTTATCGAFIQHTVNCTIAMTPDIWVAWRDMDQSVAT